VRGQLADLGREFVNLLVVCGLFGGLVKFGVPRSTYYRSQRPPAPPRLSPPRRPPPRALSSDEQAAVRAQPSCSTCHAHACRI
jgi:hypothetical protein